MKTKQSISGAGLAIGLGLIAIAIVIGSDTMQMQVPPTYAKVGPQVFPYVIAASMALTGAAIGYQAWQGGTRIEDDKGDNPTDWKGVWIIGAGLIVHMNLLKPLGFVPASTILFICVAFAFGSRKYLRDASIGLALSLIAYTGFSYGLGLQLPPGVLKGIF